MLQGLPRSSSGRYVTS
uniref:Uncharacterized protein n=1 Tax=Timema poppense TaxID=170557 RepID=A0A7R9HHH1_TIMPO|nr:unnamed protein product [Timema poppensis]